jgi:hypothetical protein
MAANQARMNDQGWLTGRDSVLALVECDLIQRPCVGDDEDKSALVYFQCIMPDARPYGEMTGAKGEGRRNRVRRLMWSERRTKSLALGEELAFKKASISGKNGAWWTYLINKGTG